MVDIIVNGMLWLSGLNYTKYNIQVMLFGSKSSGCFGSLSSGRYNKPEIRFIKESGQTIKKCFLTFIIDPNHSGR